MSITVSEVSKGFGGRTLFQDVNVTFNSGSNYGLTGPNGAGKSTFMKLLMKIEDTDHGTVSLPRRTGWLRQDHNAFDAHRVIDTVIMGNKRLWEAMVRKPDLIGGFNRLDSSIIKAGGGQVIAKEGADGLLGLAVDHPDYPDGLGIVIKIAHGWNAQATWYVARSVLGVLGFELRNPYPLHRQKAFIVPGVVPPDRLEALEQIAGVVPRRARAGGELRS